MLGERNPEGREVPSTRALGDSCHRHVPPSVSECGLEGHDNPSDDVWGLGE